MFPQAAMLSKNALAQGHTRRRGGKLVAFVVPNEPASDGLPQLLRRQLAITLPPFMIPSRIVLLDSIPCLPGGKVDAAALLNRLGS